MSVEAVVLLRRIPNEEEAEKTRGGPETAAAEQPKLTTTATVNRASFHADKYCEPCAKVMTKLCQSVSPNIDKGLRVGEDHSRALEPREIAIACHFGVTDSVASQPGQEHFFSLGQFSAIRPLDSHHSSVQAQKIASWITKERRCDG